MDLDKALVSSILSGGLEALRKAQQMGVSPTRLDGEGKKVYEAILDYLQKFGQLPSVDFIEGKTGIFFDGIELPVVSDPVLALVGEVNNRHLGRKIQEGLREVIEKQQAQQPLEACNALEKLVTDLRSEQIGIAAVESVWKMGPDIKAYYERIRSGVRGIQTMWPGVNDATMGFWPEDLVLFVARVGIGKSWTAVQIAHYAWSNPLPVSGRQCRVLFITTELSKQRVGMRFLAVRRKLPYGRFTKGALTDLEKFDLDREIERLYNQEGLYIIGGDFDFQIESVSAAIETCRPDLVIVDGVYLLRVQGANRTERMANAFDEVKRLAKRKKVPIVVTTQFNREVKKDVAKTVQVESIAMSDVGAWNADLIFGLIQTDDLRKERKMLFKPLKVREGEGQEFTVNWDFVNMDFSQLLESGGGGGDADERGTPTGELPDDRDDEIPF